MFLAALALQAEFGDYIPEVKYSVALYLFLHLLSWKVIRKSTSLPPAYIIMYCLLCSNVTDFIQVYGKNYFQMEHYIPKRVMEKMALPYVRDELPTLHASNAHMPREDAETEFVKVMSHGSIAPPIQAVVGF